MPRLATFLALSHVDRLATVEAMFELTCASALVALVQPRRWRRRFGLSGGDATTGTAQQPDAATVRSVRLAIARAARNLPVNVLCFPQALAARRMLARRGIPAQLYLGTGRENAGQPRFHAWLKVGEQWFTGQCAEDHYSLLLPAGRGIA